MDDTFVPPDEDDTFTVHAPSGTWLVFPDIAAYQIPDPEDHAATLSKDMIRDLMISREQAKRGQTYSIDEVRERLGSDTNE